MLVFWLSFKPKVSCSRFWLTLEEAASSWESAVDMVEARMPARISPASSAASTPCREMSLAMETMMASAAEALEKPSRAPALTMP